MVTDLSTGLNLCQQIMVSIDTHKYISKLILSV